MLIGIAASWLLGVLFGAQASSAVAFCCGALALFVCALIATTAPDLQARAWRGLVVVMALCAGVAVAPPVQTPLILSSEQPTSEQPPELDRTVELTGRVARVGWRPRGPWFALDLASGGRVQVQTDRTHVPPIGVHLDVVADVRGRTRWLNAPEAVWWSRSRPPYRLRAQSLHIVEPASRFRRVIARTRSRIRQHLRDTLPEQEAALARALVLGDRAITAGTRQAYTTAGVAHLLAISGLHVSIVVGSLYVALLMVARVLPVIEPPRWASVAAIAVALGYALITGGSPSAVRAATTASLAWCAIALGRRTTAIGTTATAVIVMSVVNPRLVYEPAFLLSIAATAAIVSGARHVSRLTQVAAISIRTFFATAPLLWASFDHVSVMALVSNVVLLPVGAALLVPLANVCAIAAFIPVLAFPATAAFSAVANPFSMLCVSLSKLSPALELAPATSTTFTLATVGCLVLALSRSNRARLLAVLPLGVALGLSLVTPSRHSLEVTVLDVGQGDATLITFADDTTMLIDTGPKSASWAVLTALRQRRVQRIDVLAVTHAHPDHDGNVQTLLDHIDIGEIWTNRQIQVEDPKSDSARTLARARAAGIPIKHPNALCGRSRTAGNSEVEVLSPCPAYDAGYSLNDNSLVIAIVHGEHRLLWLGDIEADTERRLATTMSALSPTVIKVPHHGSRTSSTADLLDAISPKVAIVSAAPFSRYGHPHPEVLARYRDAGVPIVTTAASGAVRIQIDGESDRDPRPRREAAYPVISFS